MRFLRIYILLLLFLVQIVPSQGKTRKRILVLHSYHQGLTWTDNVNRGIIDVIDTLSQPIEINYEYLDTKRNPSGEYLNKLIELYDTKLHKQKYDVIIVSDNNALSFMKNHRKEYFSQTPVVFCGINHFTEDLIEGMDNITGVSEEVDLQGTIDLMRKTQPHIHNVVVINDNKTTTGKLNKSLMKDVERKSGSDLNFIFWEDINMDDLVDKVSHIKGDTAILMLTFNKDKTGKFYSFHDNLDLLVPKSKVPIFISWAFYMADGVIGGKVVSGRLHGRTAAHMALNIIDGVSADSIPVVMTPLDFYQVNYKELKRFNVDKKLLPTETVMVNAPRSFYSENKKWIHLLFAVMVLSGCIILILSRAIIRRMRAEEALLVEQGRLKNAVKHERLMGRVARLLNSTNDFKNVLDELLSMVTEELNVAKISLYSFSDDKQSGKRIKSRLSVKGQNIEDVNELYFSQISSIIDRVRNNKSLVSSDMKNLTSQERSYYHSRNIEAIVVLPVKVEDRIMGLVGFAQNKPYKWSREEINLFSTMVNMLANAWERNTLINDRLVVEQRNIEAMRMLEESSRLASIGVMAAGITHEINQPLNAIKICADSVLFWQKRNPDVLPEMFLRKMKSISEGTTRIDGIIKHMRAFWEKPHNVEDEEVDMVHGVQRSLSLIKRQVYDHSIELVEELPDFKILVHANYMQFEQIIINLLVNAIHSLDKVVKEKKTIRLVIYQNEQMGILEVHDNGTGIAPDLQDKIYDPFFSTKGPKDGTGLGMAIVKSFMDRFHAQISHYNNEDGGATFVLKFNKTGGIEE